MLAHADVVITMLPDLPDLIALVDGPQRLLDRVVARTVLVVGSTVDPHGVRLLAADVRDRTKGLVNVLGAPVSGGTEGAQSGELAIMVGGDRAGFDIARPALQTMGRTVRHLGQIGAGSRAKACVQMVVAATTVALSETFSLARAAGLESDVLLDLLAGGMGASRVLDQKGQNFVTGSYAGTGGVKYLLKDLGFALSEGRLVGTTLRQADLSALLFAQVVAAGRGEEDISAVQAITDTVPCDGAHSSPPSVSR